MLFILLVPLLGAPQAWRQAPNEATAGWAGTALNAEKHPAAFKVPFSPLLSNENPHVIC